MAVGGTSLITDKYGFPTTARIGPRIAMDVGCTSLTTAGPGFPTSPGDGRRITTDAGSFMAGTGVGGLGQYMPDTIRSGRRLMCPSSDSAGEDGDSTSVSAATSATSAGCLAALEIASSRGTAAASTA